jgi:transglutaminase/protease-like cytokinesis protein 3
VSRIIISIIITIFLVVSPIVGQLVDQQAVSNMQESLYIQSNESSRISGNAGSINIQPENKTAEEVPAATEAPAEEAEQDTEESQETDTPEATQTPEAAETEQKQQETKTGNQAQSQQTSSKAASTQKPESSSKPAPKASSTPKASQAPTSTANKAGAASKPAPTVTPSQNTSSKPAPSAAPSQSSTPKPSPKAEAKSESKAAETKQTEKESKPLSNDKVFDTSKVNSGTLGVRYYNTSGKRVKLMIEKGDSRYTYNLAGDGSLETFPLQSGNGEYTVSIMENTEGNKYRYVLTEKITVKAKDENSPYLGSVQMIKWSSNMAPIKKAKELTSGAGSDDAKVKKIYNFVVSNIRYDKDKLDKLPSTYVPNIESTYKTKSGICYDFASLTAAMLRSVGIPTKLVKGYADGVKGYHAWNEVYMGGKWVVIDTSYDAQMRENGASYSMIKSKSKYQAKKVY